MKENNNLDNLFKRKIPPGEQIPPHDVWENISARLSTPRKKKPLILPFWYKVAGVAAAFILIFTLFPESDETFIDTPSVTKKPFEDHRSQTEGTTEGNISREASKTGTETPGDQETIITAAKPEIPPGNTETGFPADSSERSGMVHSGIDPLIIPFKPAKVDPSNFSLSAKTIDLVNLNLELETLKKLEEKQEENAEDLVEETSQKEQLETRFSIAPTVAAVYSGKMGSGNTLDEKFAGNSNPGKVTLAYGFSLAYQMSQKVKIRAGFNNVNLSSKTQNVDNASAANSSAIDKDAASNYVIPDGSGTLNQQLRFLEIPLELEYALVDKKVGLNLIAGASTFFLQENEVNLNSSVLNVNLGPANNLNRTSFSANLGLGFKYRFSSKFQLNLDPILKYQINTFENVDDLKPYLFGIYSGIRFQF